ncbi:hypothetical protein wTkk_000834 [Wolbachia endosymbiont of Trichogramma kaykai]
MTGEIEKDESPSLYSAIRMGDIEATELVIKFGEMSMITMIIMNVIVHHYILLSGISSLK